MRDKGKLLEQFPIFFDKLGERMAFEQIGVGLFDALARKRQGLDGEQDFSLETIERFRQEELSHLRLLERSLRTLGGNLAVPTRSASLINTASLGLQKIVQNSFTSFTDSLEAMLIAELTDNTGWELLIPLARQANLVELAWEFQGALQEESEHLRTFRSWVEEITLREGKVTKWVA